MEMFSENNKYDEILKKCSPGTKSKDVEIAKLNYLEGYEIIK